MAVENANDQPKPIRLIDTSLGTSPGLAEALKQLDPGKYPAPQPLSPMQMVKNYFGIAKSMANIALSQLDVTADNPSALATAVPLVQKLRIDRALNTIASVPEGKILVDVLKDSGIPVKMDHNFMRTGAHLGTTTIADTSEGFKSSVSGIVVPAYSTHGHLVAFLTHELQHLNQHQNGELRLAKKKFVSPLEAIWYDAAIEADAQATAVDVAYKLKQAGKPDAWDELKNSRTAAPEFTKYYEDAIKKNPNAAESGQAKRAAYDAWFDARFSNGTLMSASYAYQGWRSYKVSDMALSSAKPGGAEIGPLQAADIHKLGGLSRVNYFDAPGGRPLDDPRYRRMPPLDASLAKILANDHRNYQSHYFDYQKKMLAGLGVQQKTPTSPHASGPQSEMSAASPLKPVDWERMLEKQKADETLGKIVSPKAKAALGMLSPGTQNKPAANTGITAPKPRSAT